MNGWIPFITRMVMQIVLYPKLLTKVEELGCCNPIRAINQTVLLWKLHCPGGNACHLMIGLHRRDTFLKMYFFTDCNKVKFVFFILYWWQLFDHNHSFLLHFTTGLKIRTLEASGTSGKVKQQAFGLRNLILVPCPNHYKTSKSVSFLNSLNSSQSCLGTSIFSLCEL